MSPAELQFAGREAISQLPLVITPYEHFAASGNRKFKDVFFTRDSCYSARHLLPKLEFLSEEVRARVKGAIRNSLRVGAKFQGKTFNPETGEMPGMLPHEIHDEHSNQERLAELAKNFPVRQIDGHFEMINYFGLDETPLWVGTAIEYFNTTQDYQFLEKVMPNIEAALNWCLTFGDKDEDGLIEGQAENGNPISNRWWKDSDTSLIDEEGNRPVMPIAPIDANSFAYRAFLLAAKFYQTREEFIKSNQFFRRAEDLKALINKRYWCPDLENFAPALDGNKKPIKVVTSDSVIALWCGVVESDKVYKLITRLLKPDLFTPYGLRTRSRLSKQYNPKDYQNGNVWGHLAPIAAVSCENLGFVKQAAIFDSVIPKSHELNFAELEVVDDNGQMHEYLERGEPAACAPQAFHLMGIINRTVHLLRT